MAAVTKSSARVVNADYARLREHMTEQERAELDRLLWNPQNEIKRYRTDPVAFAREVLKITLPPYQERILTLLARHRRVCVRGPRGMGKTTAASVAILWFLATRDECKVPTITGVWRQLIEFLWPEIHKWALKAEWWRVGLDIRKDQHIFSTKLEISKNRMAFAMASDDPNKIEGAHSDSVLVVFDEAKIIPDTIWDSAEGVLTGPDCFALAISTPGDSIGRFYDIQMGKPGFEDWRRVAVTIDEVMEAGRVPKEWVAQRRAAWGERSVMFRRQALGQFAEDEAETIIPFSAIEAAQERWHKREAQLKEMIDAGADPAEAEFEVWGTLTHVGCDPARFGVDRTGYALRYGPYGVRSVNRTHRMDTMETAAEVRAVLDANPGSIAMVDVNGLGAGVVDRLQEEKYGVTPIQTGSKTALRDATGFLQFFDYRSWLWWNFREVLTGEGSEFALPPDDELARDLLAARRAQTAGEKIRIIGKDEMRKILGRSPDVGEAVLYTAAPEQGPYKPLMSFF
jgi:hypothetical protein